MRSVELSHESFAGAEQRGLSLPQLVNDFYDLTRLDNLSCGAVIAVSIDTPGRVEDDRTYVELSCGATSCGDCQLLGRLEARIRALVDTLEKGGGITEICEILEARQ